MKVPTDVESFANFNLDMSYQNKQDANSLASKCLTRHRTILLEFTHIYMIKNFSIKIKNVGYIFEKLGIRCS